MTDAPLPSTFERLLFSCTRVFALATGAACLVGIAGGLFVIITLFGTSSTHVSYNDVKAVAGAPKTTDEAADVTIPDVVLPTNVQTHLAGENRKVLRGWLEGLDPDQKRDFLLNMSEVIQGAEQSSADVTEAINKYKTMKLQKLAATGLEKYAVQVRRGAVIGLIAFMVLVLAISSLGLVLLSVERNTRHLAAHGVQAQP